MSASTKTVIGILIGIIVIGGAWWLLASRNAGPSSPTAPTAETNPGTMPAATTSPAQAQAPAIVSTDTSDAALNQDLTNIDSELNGISADSAAVDTSMNQSTTAQ